LLRLAECDVVECASYLHQSNPSVAVQFLDAFDSTRSLLQEFPYLGGVCEFASPNLQGIRVWSIAGFKNHLVFYRILPDEIEIVRVLHAARDLDNILENMPE
jgi:toxin ParE1/3/4